MNLFENIEKEPREKGPIAGGKVRYSGTEKIEKRIYDNVISQVSAHMDKAVDDLRETITAEIRSDLQPETAPYDRLRVIEQRIHELSKTQDGIVREIVDLKALLTRLSREVSRPPSVEAVSASPSASGLPGRSPAGKNEAEGYETVSVSRDASAYGAYERQPSGLYQDPSGLIRHDAAAPAGKRVPWPSAAEMYRPAPNDDGAAGGKGSLLFEELPLPKRGANVVLPSQPAPSAAPFSQPVSAAWPASPVPPAPSSAGRPAGDNDPFFFGKPAADKTAASSDIGFFDPLGAVPAVSNDADRPAGRGVSAQPPGSGIPSSGRPSAVSARERHAPASLPKARKPYTDDDDGIDYNKDCEYIIAEKSNPAGRPRGRSGRSSPNDSGRRPEKVIENNDEDSEIISCD